MAIDAPLGNPGPSQATSSKARGKMKQKEPAKGLRGAIAQDLSDSESDYDLGAVAQANRTIDMPLDRRARTFRRTILKET